MSYITKYLESLMTKKDRLDSSSTTDSLYYLINGITIRVSDHFSMIPGRAHIDIVNPINDRTLYMVKIKEGLQLLTFNLAGLKVFIQNYLYISQIKGKNKEIQNNKKAVKQPKENWSTFCMELAKIYKIWNKLNTKKRAHIRKYYEKNGKVITLAKLKEANKLGLFELGVENTKIKEFLEGS